MHSESASSHLTSINQLLEARLLDLHGGNVEGDELSFSCLEHGDAKPSASWNQKKGLWNCFACGASGATESLAALMGLGTVSDGYKRSTTSKLWSLKGMDGTVVATHVRRDYPDGSKDFFWKGGLGGRKSSELPLYGYHLLSGYKSTVPIVVVEGEQCVDLLLECGVQAVGTVTGASSAPDPEVLSCLTEYELILWPDNDDIGLRHMQKVAQNLNSQVRFISWRDAPNKGDAADFVRSGGSFADVMDLINAAEVPGPQPLLSVPSSPSLRELGTDNYTMATHELVSMRELELLGTQSTEWLLESRLPRAGISLVAARPKVGKTEFCCNLALKVSRGEPFLGFKTMQGPVMYLAHEGNPADLKSRVFGFGANASDPISWYLGRPPIEVSAYQWLRQVLEQYRPALVVIDTVSRFLTNISDFSDYAIVGRAFGELEYIARECSTHIMMVHHANKGASGSGDLGQSVLGSVGIVAAVDTVFELRSHPTRQDVRVLSSLQREGESLPPTAVARVSDGTLENLGPVEFLAVNEMMRRIVETLRDQGALNGTELKSKCGGKAETYQRARSQLCDEGSVITKQSGHKTIYHLPTTDSGGSTPADNGDDELEDS